MLDVAYYSSSKSKKVLVGHLIYIGDKIRIIGEVPQDT